MKKLFILPLLLVILLATGCSLKKETAPSLETVNLENQEQAIEIIPESDGSLELEVGEMMLESEILVEESEPAVFCTMDAQICPDGSAVGRIAPDCEFAPCPGQ